MIREDLGRMKRIGMKCNKTIMIDQKPTNCDRSTDIIGGYFWCHFCNSYVKDPLTKEPIRYE